MPAPPPRALRPAPAISLAAWGGLLALAIGFSVVPLYNGWYAQTTRKEKNKDYDVWYRTAQNVLAGRPIYTAAPFDFMYPPTAATVFALAAPLGRVPFLLILLVIQGLAWAATVFLSVRLVTGRAADQHPLLYLLPTAFCLPYIWGVYLLGQPNLVLLTLLLVGFLLLQKKRPATAGALFAFAAAFKAFPVLVLPYLLYRRQWRATLSMIVMLAVFLLVLPMPFRGPRQAVSDLVTWTQGMTRYDADAIAQRGDYGYVWKNQSLVAAANRLLRHVPVEQTTTVVNGQIIERVHYANLANLDFRIVNAVIVIAGLALCLFFVWITPRERDRTPRTDAIEQAMLLVLLVLFSPFAWYYYGIWLFLAFAVILYFILTRPAHAPARRVAVVWLVACLALANFVLPVDWMRPLRNLGITFFGDLLLLGLLGWIMRVERRATRDGERGASSVERGA